MAEEKKSGGNDAFEEAVMLFFGIMLLGVISERITNLLRGEGRISPETTNAFISFLTTGVFPFLKIFAFIVSVLSFIGIVYAVKNLTEINVALNQIYNPPLPDGESAAFAPPPKNVRWERVLTHLGSASPNDWKFAIIEADIILSDMLDAMGYRGETVADKLKSVEKSDFQSIEAAWEGHKTRNAIAHEGADYMITQREARRVIELYRQVFEEFEFI